MKVKTDVDGRTISVEGEDVLAWVGDPTAPDTSDGDAARARAEAYIRANPRPDPDAQGGVNIPARQRMALLRRLAAGPATKTELLEAMRRAAGYVGGDDWRNRYDELRGHGKRGGGHLPLPIQHDEASDTYRLIETFATLSDGQRRSLAHAKAALDERMGQATVVLDGLLPDVTVVDEPAWQLDYASSDALATLDLALERAAAIELRHLDDRRGRRAALLGVPKAYVTTPGGLAVHLVEIDPAGHRVAGAVVSIRDVRDVILHPEVEIDPLALEPVTTPLHLRAEADVATRLIEALAALGIDVARPTGGDGVVLVGELDVDLARQALDALLLVGGGVTVRSPSWLAAGAGVIALRLWLAQAGTTPSIPAGAAESGSRALAALEAQLAVPNGEPVPPVDWLD